MKMRVRVSELLFKRYQCLGEKLRRLEWDVTNLASIIQNDMEIEEIELDRFEAHVTQVKRKIRDDAVVVIHELNRLRDDTVSWVKACSINENEELYGENN